MRWRSLLIVLATLPCFGCQLGYYLSSAYHQTELLEDRKPIAKVLKYSHLSDKEKHKLELVQEAKAFAESELGLKKSDNYTTYVQLHDPYVTYIVQAAYAHELKPYLWRFPFVGSVPYKGYFTKDGALEEARAFPKDQFDTYVRGVSAYSTLGWFQDSVLSSMLRYPDFELVALIIHETVHTTLFIKSAAEFNERMATFMGQEGMRLFYLKKEGLNSPNLKLADKDAHDQKLFSEFLTKEINSLKKWYKNHKGKVTDASKAERLAELRDDYVHKLKPKLETEGFSDFESPRLNNAMILAYQTYDYSLDDFQKLYDHFHDDFKKTLQYLKGLEDDPHPAQTLRDFVSHP